MGRHEEDHLELAMGRHEEWCDFEVNKEIMTTAQKSNIYSGSGINKETEMQDSVGAQHCYTVTAKVGQITSPDSNKVCFTQIAVPAS